MTDLLPRLFIRNHKNTGDPKVRAAYGTLSGIVGIIVNLLLFTGKFILLLVILDLGSENGK